MCAFVDAARPFHFGTKAETLQQLSRSIRSAVVLPMEYFTVRQWREDPDGCLNLVCSQTWSASTLVVRSSGQGEDSTESSNAGRYLSERDVRGRDALTGAVRDVIASFDEDRSDHQILVQPQLENAVASGVVSSCEPGSGAPYRVVEWTAGAETDEVTSGRSEVRTWYYLEAGRARIPSPVLAGLPPLVDELTELTKGVPFEFEFGITRDRIVVLFQVRPLVNVRPRISRAAHGKALAECERILNDTAKETSFALGERTVLGVMPDWNPAEMIGIRPRPLALSLYRGLITDRVWARSRYRYGYRDLRGVPLLVDLCGLPYIDTRASFSSLVPAPLNENAARGLVAHYVAELAENPHLHDKIEFAIALSSYHFATEQQAERLAATGVLSAEDSRCLVKELRELTIGIMSSSGPYQRDLREARLLASRSLDRPDAFSLARLTELVRVCGLHGTLPFSGLARAAFAATSIVRSLVDVGLLTPDDADSLLGSAQTPISAMRDEFSTLPRAEFLARYGHLRPGTYDIRSPRYDESPEQYFDWSMQAPPAHRQAPFRPSARQLGAIERLLRTHLLPEDPRVLLRFVVESIAAREYSKLQFSRFVSEILVEIRRAGTEWGLTADDMSYVDIDVLTGLKGERGSDQATVVAAVERGRSRYAITESLCAPAVVLGPAQLTSFVSMRGEANFVTRSRSVARTADVASGDDPEAAIAMIMAADPGYDWIFTRGIAGLITAYGGVNSHMAIRARELGIPAAIGVGHEAFRRWLREEALEVDAASRIVRPAALSVPRQG
ncbi:PEP-utilizing enzyme [Saccharomonospora sp. NPDC006951]